MHNKKPHIQSVGKIHKVLFDYLVGTGVGTSAITQDGNRLCIRILFPEVIVPDPFDVLTYKLRCVVTDSHCHITDILCDIVYAVRNKHSVTERAEVVVVRPQASVRKCLAGPFEVAEQFLLLGVDADDRDAGLLQRLAYGRNVLELLVPVLDISHRNILAERTFTKTETIKYLSDMVPRDFMPGFGKLILDMGLGYGYPYHPIILGKTGSVGFYNLNDRLDPFRVLGQNGMTSATLSADTAFSERLPRLQFLQSNLKSMCADSHFCAKFAITEPLIFETFCLCRKEQSSASFVQAGHIRLFIWREYFWRSFRVHLYALSLLYKDTEFPPDLLYHIIDNQIIKLIFCTMLPRRGQASSGSGFKGRNYHSMAA